MAERNKESADRSRRPRAERKKRPSSSKRQLKTRRHTLSPVDQHIQSLGNRPAITSESINALAEQFDIVLTEQIKSKLLDYVLLVRDINREINLVSRLSEESVLLSSLIESLFVAKLSDFATIKTVLDLGTGGGFPGIPLTLIHDSVQTTLLDSRRAKILALRRIVDELSLSVRTKIIHDRAETLSDHSDFRFDAITIRAVGSLKEILPWCESLLAVNGRVYAWKGPEGIRELKSAGEDWSLIDRIPIFSHKQILVIGRSS